MLRVFCLAHLMTAKGPPFLDMLTDMVLLFLWISFVLTHRECRHDRGTRTHVSVFQLPQISLFTLAETTQNILAPSLFVSPVMLFRITYEALEYRDGGSLFKVYVCMPLIYITHAISVWLSVWLAACLSGNLIFIVCDCLSGWQPACLEMAPGILACASCVSLVLHDFIASSLPSPPPSPSQLPLPFPPPPPLPTRASTDCHSMCVALAKRKNRREESKETRGEEERCDIQGGTRRAKLKEADRTERTGKTDKRSERDELGKDGWQGSETGGERDKRRCGSRASRDERGDMYVCMYIYIWSPPLLRSTFSFISVCVLELTLKAETPNHNTTNIKQTWNVETLVYQPKNQLLNRVSDHARNGSYACSELTMVRKTNKTDKSNKTHIKTNKNNLQANKTNKNYTFP